MSQQSKDLNGDGLGYQALSKADAILASIDPDGVLVGQEYMLLNPHRPDREPGSFKINLQTGAWADFATTDARGHGLISFVEYYFAVDGSKARQWLRGALNLEPAPRDMPKSLRSLERTVRVKRTPEAWKHGPLPDDRSSLSYAYPTNFMRCAPDQIDEYKNPKGEGYLLVLRWNAGTLGPDKQVRPAIWARPSDDKNAPFRWAPSWPVQSYPLHADKIAKRPKASIVIVEGEKSARRGADYFPDRIVTTIPSHCDLSIFKNRSVIIWPDADEAGVNKAQKQSTAITAAGAESVHVVPVPRDVPAKWDLGDDLPDGWTPAVVRKIVARAESAAISAAPDRMVLDWSRGEPPELDLSDCLPSWVDWVNNAADSAGAPAEYVFGTLLATAAGMVCGTAEIEISAAWKEDAATYLLNIGDSSSGKTPAARAVEEGLTLLETNIFQDYQQRKAAWELQCAQIPRGQRHPPEPDFTRVRVADATVEAIGHALAQEERGLLSWQGEGVEWISSLTRFKQNGASDEGFWLKSWDGQPGSISRRGLGNAPLIIPVQSVSIAMGAQPDAVTPLMTAKKTGLQERFLFLWPSPRKLEVRKRDVTTSGAQMIHRALERLFQMALRHAAETDPARKKFHARMTDSAYEHFEHWRVGYLQQLRDEHGTNIPSALGKAPSHVARMCLNFHLLEWAAGNTPRPHGVIKIENVQHAIDMWEMFAAHRALVESDAEEPDQERLGRTLARWIVREKIEVIEPFNLRRQIRLPGLRSDEAVRLALIELEAAKWLAAGTDISRKDWDKLPQNIAIREGVTDLAIKNT